MLDAGDRMVTKTSNLFKKCCLFLPIKSEEQYTGRGGRVRKTAGQSMSGRMAVQSQWLVWLVGGETGLYPQSFPKTACKGVFHSFRHTLQFSFFFFFFQEKYDFKEWKSQCWEFLVLVGRSFNVLGYLLEKCPVMTQNYVSQMWAIHDVYQTQS